MTMGGYLWEFNKGQNVVDPYGSLDSSSGITACIESNYVPLIPGGLYRVDQTVPIDLVKAIMAHPGYSVSSGL